MDNDLRQQLIDRFEAWELVDYLQISVEEIIDGFQDKFEDNIEDVLDLLGLRNERNDD